MLLGALITSTFAWKLKKERGVNPDDIKRWIKYAKVGNPQVGIVLTDELAEIYRDRLEKNKDRADSLRIATGWVIAAASVATVELIFALITSLI